MSSRLIRLFSKLVQIWRERGLPGLLHFIYDRIQRRRRIAITYPRWVEEHRLTPRYVATARLEMQTWARQPTISVIMPVYNVEAQWLERAIQSVCQQIYPHWQLCVADDASTQPHIREILTRYQQQDDRIQVVFRSTNGNIVAASNSALDLATGDYLALLDHDDELSIDALFEVAKLINQHPDADFIYSDEDQITADGRRCHPFFKPDWSPDYFYACMYTCHLGVYRTDLVRAIGGFRVGYEGSQDYDLVLRVVEQTTAIYHISKILYHWRIIPASVTSGDQAKPWAYVAARRALQDALDRSAFPGHVEDLPWAGFYRVRRTLQAKPLISIIIPSAGKSIATSQGARCLLEHCLRSIRDRSTYAKVEIVVVDGGDISAAVLEAIQPFQAQVVHCREPFNFSQRINRGVAQSTGEMVLLLNDDVEVRTPDWLESMLEFAQQPAIGAVGAKLLYPDGNLQHIGVMVLNGNPGHAFHNVPSDHPGYFRSNQVNRNYWVVTGACLMMRRSVFDQLGGMDETFPLNYNDVDLCLKAHQAGYRNVVTPFAELIHYESATRPKGLQPKEWERLNQKWQSYFQKVPFDPYYNPNLALHEVTFELG